jgi:hypothetical protein
LLDFIYIINTRYIALKYLIILLKEEASNSLIILVYNNIFIATIYKINIVIILIEINK